MGLLTVSSVSSPRAVWSVMPQDRRKSTEDYDAINPDFPPPSLKSPQTDGGKDVEKPKKKDKKWSLGGLFRRKKKVSDTDSSSPVEDEEEKKGFLERRRAARKRRNRGSKDVTGSFEHVIINPPRSQNSETVSPEQIRSKEIVSERLVGRSHETLAKRQEVGQIRGSSVSLEAAGRKGGRIQVKARVEASREQFKADSSSDEGGGSSRHSSSSMQRAKNDENMGSKDGSLSRRSRAARTERYKKRLSRDEESLRDFQVSPPSRISRSDERLANKKTERAPGNSRWTAKVVYYESSDYDTKYTAKTKSATPSPIGSPKVRPKNALHYTTSAPASSNYVTFPPSHAREGVAGSHQELRSKNYPKVLAENVQKSNQRYTDVTPPRLPKSSSDMISKSPFPYSLQKQYPAWGPEVLNRKSASYDCNVNSLHYVNNQISQPHPTDENILVVQFPISRPTQKTDTKVAKMGVTPTVHHHKQPNPPPPPPRDPHRRLVPSNGYIHETSPRPMSYAFEDRNQHQSRYSGFPEFGSSVSAFQRVPQTTPIDFQQTSATNKHHRSSSDHQIPSRINSVKNSPPTKRKSSAQPEPISRQYSVNTELAVSPPTEPTPHSGVPHHYQYYTDQQPRSRKPIHISYQNQRPQQPNESYLSDSQVVLKPPVQQNTRARPPGVQNAADFWKQKDQESSKKIHLSEGSPKLIQRHFLNVSTPNDRSRSNSPHNEGQLVTSKLKLPPLKMPARGAECSGSLSSQSSPRDIPGVRTQTTRKLVHNEIGIPVFDSSDVNNASKRDYRPLSMLEEKQEQEISPMKEKLINPPTPPTRRDSKVNAVTSFEHFDVFGDDNEGKDGGRRDSSNLEEALNELEAIYKSLRLGDEGYLEKVAKEKAVYENNRLDPSNWNAWVQSRGFESDSSFNYSRSSLESVDSLDSPLRRNNTRRSGVPDRVTDDMAYRRLNKKDRPPPQEQEVISQAGSFLLVSPTLSPPPFIESPPVTPGKNEPDVTLDDVVYRNIKHVQNTLKVMDPQPPFGIPLGPITPAPTSDYLHVTHKETYRPTFKPRKTPDVVSDDLAFRNLRKDNNKEPLFTPEDTTLIDSPTLKKKRAVRSLSANLLSIIQKESKILNNNNTLFHNNNSNGQNDLEKSQSFTDVTDANNMNDRGPNIFLGEERRLGDINTRKNLSGDDSDTTPRVSRHFTFGTSSPMIATSSETLTGSKNSLVTQESRTPSQKLSQNSSPRLSLTPERRHTTDSIHLLPRKSVSPAKHVPFKSESFKNNSTIPQKTKFADFRRSPTPDSHTFTYHSDKQDKRPPIVYDQTESDLLAILAREAKEASEQLSKELNELNFDKKTTTVVDKSVSINDTPQNDVVREIYSKESSTQFTTSKPLVIGKIIPHKPVKLNTFCITEDNKLENKQTVVTEKPVEIEGSKSMTDLLKELTRTLDFDFGTSPKENENQSEIRPTLSEEQPEELPTPDDTIEQEIFSEAIEPRPGRKDSEETYFSSLEEMPCKSLSPAEASLLSSLHETTAETEQRAQTTSPVNSFPLNLSDENDREICKLQPPETRSSNDQQPTTPCDIDKVQTSDDPNDFKHRGDLDSDDRRLPGGCSMDCSSLADEGKTSLKSCVTQWATCVNNSV